MTRDYRKPLFPYEFQWLSRSRVRQSVNDTASSSQFDEFGYAKLFMFLLLIVAGLNVPLSAETHSKPNVLFIAIDDLNDWIGCLGGHPQALTPHLDRLAQRGILFRNAHCASPLCNPSRTAVFSGRQPLVTGVFANDESSDIRKLRPDITLIPQHFAKAGYQTFGCGKLLHKTNTKLFDEDFFPELRWSPFETSQVSYRQEELATKGTSNPRHVTELLGKPVVLPFNRMPSDRGPDSPAGESFDWGPVDVQDEEMGDGKIAVWMAEVLRRQHDRPYFAGIGFYRPHIPLFAPRKYFDLYEGVEIALPKVKSDDLEDLSPTARERALAADTAGSHATVLQYEQWQSAVKAYLACIAFVDAQVGKLLDALDASPNANNTIIVLWGDHGWHLGEKQHWGKWTPWERSTHVPLIVAPTKSSRDSAFPDVTSCSEPVSLLDLFPTLVELCQLPPLEGLDGHSLVPLLENPLYSTDRTVLTTIDKGNYSLIDTRWHYIRYVDGAEELYDRQRDPHEWNNLATDPSLAEVRERMARLLPKENDFTAPAAGNSGVKKSKATLRK
jgi:arylsulfatase A-like enzyme